MTHVPCPPVKITPVVFQRCSIIGCAANENNGACGEETRQTKRRKKKRPLGRKYLQVYFIHIHHPLPFPSDYLPTHTHVEIFKTHNPTEVLMGFQWQSNLAIFQSSLQALCFAEGGLWVIPNKDASLHGPTTCGLVGTVL